MQSVTKKLRNLFFTLQSNRLYWLIIALTLLHIVPIWLFKYFPSQDGPSHIENAYTLLHYFDHDALYNQYYDLNLDFVPNWLSHIELALLMLFVSPLTAEKIFLTIYVVVFVLSILYFLESVDKESSFFTLFAFPFIYNFLLHMGFYNFVFSVPLMFLAIGYWWRRRSKRLDWGLFAGLNLLLVFLFFCHLVSQLLAITSILFLAAMHYRTQVKKTFSFAAALIPSYIFPFYYLYTHSGQSHATRWTLEGSWRYFFGIGSLISYDLRELFVSGSLAVLLAALAIYTILREKIGLSGRRLRLKITLRDSFFLLAIVFSFLSVYMPNNMSGGGFVTHRLNLYPFLIILPWLSSTMSKPGRYVVGALAVTLILFHLAFTTYYYKLLNTGLEEYTSGIPFVGKNETILPVSFNDDRGESGIVRVYLHATGYYCAAKGSVDLSNYEARTNYFPLKYKSSVDPSGIGIRNKTGDIRPWAYPRTIDYILLWAPMERFAALEWIEKNYTLIHSQGRLKLYKRLGLLKAALQTNS